MDTERSAGGILMFPTFLKAPIPWGGFRQGDLAYCVIIDPERGLLSAVPSPRMRSREVEGLGRSVAEAQARIQQGRSAIGDLEAYAVHLPTVYGTEPPERFLTVGEAAVRARTLLEFGIRLRAYRKAECAAHADHDLVFDVRHPPEVYRHPVVAVSARFNVVELRGGDDITDRRHEGFYCLTCERDVPQMELGLTPGFRMNMSVT